MRGRLWPALTQRFGLSHLERGFGVRPYDTTTAFDQFGRDVVLPYVVNGKLPVYDHEKEVFGETPLSYETQADVSGGTSDTKYFLSGAWKYDGGIMKNTGRVSST